MDDSLDCAQSRGKRGSSAHEWCVSQWVEVAKEVGAEGRLTNCGHSTALAVWWWTSSELLLLGWG